MTLDAFHAMPLKWETLDDGTRVAVPLVWDPRSQDDFLRFVSPGLLAWHYSRLSPRAAGRARWDCQEAIRACGGVLVHEESMYLNLQGMVAFQPGPDGALPEAFRRSTAEASGALNASSAPTGSSNTALLEPKAVTP